MRPSSRTLVSTSFFVVFRESSSRSSAQADGPAPLFDQGLTPLLISFRRRRIRYACCSPCDDEAGGRSQVPRPKDGREDAGLAAGGEATRRARARGRQGVRLSAPIRMCTFIFFISAVARESSRSAVVSGLARAERAECLCVALSTLALSRIRTAILVSISPPSYLWRCLSSAVNQDSRSRRVRQRPIDDNRPFELELTANASSGLGDLNIHHLIRGNLSATRQSRPRLPRTLVVAYLHTGSLSSRHLPGL